MKVSEILFHKRMSESFNDLPYEYSSLLSLIFDGKSDVSELFLKCKEESSNITSTNHIGLSALRLSIKDIVEVSTNILDYINSSGLIVIPDIKKYYNDVGMVKEAATIALSQVNENPPSFQWLSISIK